MDTSTASPFDGIRKVCPGFGSRRAEQYLDGLRVWSVFDKPRALRMVAFCKPSSLDRKGFWPVRHHRNSRLGVSLLRSVHAWSTVYCDDHSDGYGCFYVRACSFFSAFVLSADPDRTPIVIRRSWIFRSVKDRRCLGEFHIRSQLALEQFS